MHRRKPQGRRPFSLLRWLTLTGSCLAVAALLLLVSAPTLVTRFIRSYLQKEAFRQQAEAAVSAATGGEASLSPLVWSDDTATASELEVHNAHGWDVNATGAHAALNFGTIRAGVWSIENVGADELSLHAKPASRHQKTVSTQDNEVSHFAPSSAVPSFLRSYIPSKVNVSTAEVERFSLEKDGWSINDSHLSTGSWTSGRTTLQAKLSGGTVHMPIKLPEQPAPLETNLEQASLKFSPSQLQLFESRLRWKQSAKATVRGTLKTDSGEWEVKSQITDVPLSEFLNSEWKSRLTGQMRGDVQANGAKNQAAQWTAELVLEDGSLQGLPILSTLASYTRMERFKRLTFDTFQATVQPKGDALVISKIVIQSNGLLRIEGTLTLLNDSLDGHFLLGVTSEALQWIPGAQNRIFTGSNAQAPSGFHWTQVRVGGTKQAPQEDLSARLLGGAGMALVFDTPGKILDQGAQTLLKPVLGEDASKLPGQIIQGAGGVLENGVKTGAELLNKVVPVFPGVK